MLGLEAISGVPSTKETAFSPETNIVQEFFEIVLRPRHYSHPGERGWGMGSFVVKGWGYDVIRELGHPPETTTEVIEIDPITILSLKKVIFSLLFFKASAYSNGR